MKLSPREELLKLHQRIYRQNRRVIEDSVIHEDKSFRAFEARYLRAVRNYEAISSPEECLEAVLEARLVYVGDYHTLNQSQRSLLRLLRMLVEKTRDFVLAIEVIFARHQRFLERYLKGTITDETFLKKVGFREHWFFDLWENFKPLFDFAKYHTLPVFGLEADSSVGTTLAHREREMAKRIVHLLIKYPDKKMVVFVGDLHIAPPHLPQEVDFLLKEKNLVCPAVILYQNSESIYWKLAHEEQEDKAVVVRISQNEFCRMHTPPIIAQQSYLNWLEHEEAALDYADAKKTFLEYLDRIAGYMDITLGKEKEEVEVFTCGDLSFLKNLSESKLFTPRELKAIKQQILHSESYYIPKKKYVYLANVSVNHASEEASHTIRHLCAGDEFPRPMQDAFYANILHEALGFFGSKIINPRRKCLHPADCRKLIDYLKASKTHRQRYLEYQIALTFLEHEKNFKKGQPFSAARVALLPVDLFIGVTHAIGYYLGEKMFFGLLQEKIAKSSVRDLFFDPMDEEGTPFRRYFQLMDRTKGVRIPSKI